MNIIDKEPNTNVTIKIEPPEQKVCNVIETTCTSFCEKIKIEMVENEVPVFYADEKLREKFQALKEPCTNDMKNSNISQNTRSGYIEITVPTNLENNTNVNKTSDKEKSSSTGVNIKKLPKIKHLRNDLFYYCKVCKVKYLNEKSFECHMMLHDESRKFECDTCGYRYKSKSDLALHMIKHSDKMFECETCKYKSKWKKHISRHMKQKHGETTADKNTNMTTNDTSGSTQHTTILNIDNSQSLNKDGGKILYHQCNICNHKSFVKHALDKHMKLHDLNRKYQCDVCLYRFHTKYDLYQHMSKHSDKKYSCRVCGRQFKYEHGVTRHMHEHEGVQHKCDMCGHVCNSRNQLSTHMSRKHNNSYKCNVCLKMFTEGAHYTRHMKTHLKSKSKRNVNS